MLILHESAYGFVLFKLADGKLDENIHKEFETPEAASNLYVLFRGKISASASRRSRRARGSRSCADRGWGAG